MYFQLLLEFWSFRKRWDAMSGGTLFVAASEQDCVNGQNQHGDCVESALHLRHFSVNRFRSGLLLFFRGGWNPPPRKISRSESYGEHRYSREDCFMPRRSLVGSPNDRDWELP